MMPQTPYEWVCALAFTLQIACALAIIFMPWIYPMHLWW